MQRKIPDTGEAARPRQKKPEEKKPVVIESVVKQEQGPVKAKGPANEPTFWDGILGLIAIGLLIYGIYRFVIS